MSGLIAFMPDWIEVILISLALSFGTTLAYKYLSDQAVMKEIKASLANLKLRMKTDKGDPEKLKEIQKEMMPLNMKFFKLSMKPTLITLLPMLVVFWGLSQVYVGADGVSTHIINLPFSIPLIGNWLGWVGTYIIFSIIFSTVLRKVMKVA